MTAVEAAAAISGSECSGLTVGSSDLTFRPGKGVQRSTLDLHNLTGVVALQLVQSQSQQINDAAALLKTQPVDLLQRIALVQEQVKSLEKEVAHAKSQLAANQGNELASQAVDINGVKVIAALLDGADSNTLREVVEKLKSTLQTGAILLASVQDGKVSLVAGVTANVTAKIKAGELVNFIAQQVGGKGGGRPDIAQAGGTNPAALTAALQSVDAWIAERV